MHLNKMNHLHRHALEKILNKPCPDRIPRSGERAKDVDCYVFYVYQGESPLLLASSFDEKSITGLIWNGDRFEHEASIPLAYLESLNLKVEHFYKEYDFSYTSLSKLLIHENLKLHILKILIHKIRRKIPQFFFNRKQIAIPKRTKLLSKIVSKQLMDNSTPVSTMNMMTYLYSEKWLFHPQKDILRKELNLYLDSFAESGELVKANNSQEYRITGKAIATLDSYEIEERRHSDNKKIQRIVIFLTFILAFFAAVQSNLVKIPTLIDFSTNSTNMHNNQINRTGNASDFKSE